MKLRSKINLYTTVVFIVLVILIAGAIYFAFSKMMLDHELELSGAEISNTVEAMNKVDAEMKTADLLRAYMPVNGMLMIVEQNNQAELTVTDPRQKHLVKMTATYYKQETKKIIKHNGMLHTFNSMPIIKKDGEIANLQLVKSLDGTAHILSILRIVLLTIAVVAIIPAFISSRLLSNFISRPILSIIQTMSEIRRSGKYTRIDLPKESDDELFQMGETFNEMIDQLEKNYERQEQFVMSASHELKTPLTIIESYSSLLQRRGLQQPELFDESVHAIHSEAVRMRELTEQLLLLAKHEGHLQLTFQAINLKQAIHEAIHSFGTAFDREISLHVSEDVVVYTDQQKLKHLIYILLENACKYSEHRIKVRTSQTDGKGLIEIIDQGIGIPAADLPHIFDRFYRVDKARARKTGGFGLGLALAKEIADAIHVQVNFISEEGKGTTVQLYFNLHL